MLKVKLEWMILVYCGFVEGLLKLATIIYSLSSYIFIIKEKIVFSIGSGLKHETLKKHARLELKH